MSLMAQPHSNVPVSHADEQNRRTMELGHLNGMQPVPKLFVKMLTVRKAVTEEMRIYGMTFYIL